MVSVLLHRHIRGIAHVVRDSQRRSEVFAGHPQAHSSGTKCPLSIVSSLLVLRTVLLFISSPSLSSGCCCCCCCCCTFLLRLIALSADMRGVSPPALKVRRCWHCARPKCAVCEREQTTGSGQQHSKGQTTEEEGERGGQRGREHWDTSRTTTSTCLADSDSESCRNALECRVRRLRHMPFVFISRARSTH